MLARVRFPLAVEPNVFWLPALDSNISTVILPFLFLFTGLWIKRRKEVSDVSQSLTGFSVEHSIVQQQQQPLLQWSRRQLGYACRQRITTPSVETCHPQIVTEVYIRVIALFLLFFSFLPIDLLLFIYLVFTYPALQFCASLSVPLGGNVVLVRKKLARPRHFCHRLKSCAQFAVFRLDGWIVLVGGLWPKSMLVSPHVYSGSVRLFNLS